MKNIIEIKNLCKSFGDVKAVRDISFCVREGELFAFLGVNGAGKSTTISIICALLGHDSGSVMIDGKDIHESREALKRDIGVVFQDSVLDKALSVKDNLYSRAALYGIRGRELEAKIKELGALLDFEDLMSRSVGKLSGGQRRRIDIARALIHSPKLLILDEPTTGLDPQTRKRLWAVIESLRKTKNMTVFLTTHYMEEAADADYVVILDAGKISAEGTPHELKNKFTGDYITIYGIDEDSVKGFGKPYVMLKNAARITVADTKEATSLILKYPECFEDYEISKSKMDDVFLAVTGRPLQNTDNEEDTVK